MTRLWLGFLLWVAITFDEYDGFRFWLYNSTGYKVTHNSRHNGKLIVVISDGLYFNETYYMRDK